MNVGLIMLVLLECSIAERYMYIKPLSAPVDISEKCTFSAAKSTPARHVYLQIVVVLVSFPLHIPVMENPPSTAHC